MLNTSGTVYRSRVSRRRPAASCARAHKPQQSPLSLFSMQGPLRPHRAVSAVGVAGVRKAARTWRRAETIALRGATMLHSTRSRARRAPRSDRLPPGRRGHEDVRGRRIAPRARSPEPRVAQCSRDSPAPRFFPPPAQVMCSSSRIAAKSHRQPCDARARADRGGRAGLRPLGRHHHPTQISRTAPLARRGEQEDPPARDRCAPLLGAACGIGAEQRGCRKRESSGRAASARRCALVRGREAASTLTPGPPTHHPPPPLRGVN